MSAISGVAEVCSWDIENLLIPDSDHKRNRYSSYSASRLEDGNSERAVKRSTLSYLDVEVARLRVLGPRLFSLTFLASCASFASFNDPEPFDCIFLNCHRRITVQRSKR